MGTGSSAGIQCTGKMYRGSQATAPTRRVGALCRLSVAPTAATRDPPAAAPLISSAAPPRHHPKPSLPVIVSVMGARSLASPADRGQSQWARRSWDRGVQAPRLQGGGRVRVADNLADQAGREGHSPLSTPTLHPLGRQVPSTGTTGRAPWEGRSTAHRRWLPPPPLTPYSPITLLLVRRREGVRGCWLPPCPSPSGAPSSGCSSRGSCASTGATALPTPPRPSSVGPLRTVRARLQRAWWPRRRSTLSPPPPRSAHLADAITTREPRRPQGAAAEGRPRRLPSGGLGTGVVARKCPGLRRHWRRRGRLLRGEEDGRRASAARRGLHAAALRRFGGPHLSAQ